MPDGKLGEIEFPRENKLVDWGNCACGEPISPYANFLDDR